MKFTKTHEWVKKQDTFSMVGITEFAASELGDIVFVQLPDVGDKVEIGEAFAEVESVKAVSPVLSPVTGTVIKVNEDVIDNPEKINQDANNAWFITVAVEKFGEIITLNEYEEFIK
jgi:glycine cleavage system H protein